MDFNITYLSSLPAADRGDAAQRFESIQRISRVATYGDDDLVESMHDFVQLMDEGQRTRREGLLAIGPGGEVHGGLLIRAPLLNNTHAVVAECLAVVDSPAADELESALVESARCYARTLNRQTLWCMTVHPFATSADTSIPSDSGLAVAMDRTARLLTVAGFDLAYTSRHVRLDLRLARPSSVKVAPGYSLLVWPTIHTPEEHLAEVARLQTLLSQDSPDGDLDAQIEEWDVERVIESERTSYNGQQRLRVLALHEASRQLVGFTEVSRKEGSAAVFQNATLVESEHRGHGLGTAMKTQLLLAIAEWWPGAARIHTWNEGANDPMWRINEVLGFEPVDVGATWQLRLAP